MPELPEVRVHAERLTQAYAGRTLERFTAISFTALKTFAPAPDVAHGEALIRVGTRGKYLLMEFPAATFVVHLMQGGRLTPNPKPTAKPRGGLCRWTFHGADSLLLTEAGTERRAGVWVVAGNTESQPPIEGLGPEADSLDVSALTALLAEAGGSRLHGVLRDQRRLAGIGRRLANEICWSARLSPFAASNKLATDQIDALAVAIRGCIDESLADERGRDVMVKSADRLAHVHHRTGTPCDRCGDTVREVSYNAYTVNYCAACQTSGKILADNTTSKFLK